MTETTQHTTTTTTSILPSLPGINLISSYFTSNINPTTQDVNSPNTNSNSHSLSIPPSQSPVTPARQRALSRPTFRPHSNSDLGSIPEKDIMLATSQSRDSASEMSWSREGSFVGSEGKRRKRSSKSKTSYSICHPPPKNHQRSKLSVRARPLLQFHKQVSEGRPLPAFELLPSAIFSPKLVRAITKLFGARHGLCSGDLAIVKAEEYRKHEESSNDEDESRDVVALICGAGKKECANQGSARILFANGSDWDAVQLQSGSYECCTTDSHGLKTTVRWVQKKTPARSPDESETVATDRKFNFSTISANTRRHPIIASLTNHSLDISDMYTMPAPATSDLSPTRAQDESTYMTTTDELRTIITATSVFVAVREGWCPSYRTEESLQRSSSIKSVASSKAYATPPASPRKSEYDVARRSSSLRQVIRSPSLLRRQGQMDRPVTPTGNSPFSPLASEVSFKEPFLDAAPVRRRARADTTSTVIVNSTAGQWQPDFGNAPDEQDDEEEDEEDDEDDEKDDEDVDRAMQSDGSDSRSPSTRPQVRTISGGSASTNDSHVWNEKKAAQLEQSKQKKEKKKSRILRILACGLI